MPFLAATPEALLDASAKAHASMRRFYAQISVESTTGGRTLRTSYVLGVDGQDVLLRVREPRQAGQERSDRTFYFHADRLVAYDAVADERLSRALPKKLSNLQRMSFAMGQVNDVVRYLVSPEDLKAFYQALKQGPKWSVSSSSEGTVLSRRTGLAMTSLTLGAARPLLKRLDAVAGATVYHYRIDYTGSGPVVFKAPTSARLVGAFTVASEPPTYRSAEAEKVTKGMLAAFKRINHLRVGVDGEDGKVVLWMTGPKYREAQPGLEYAYDGKVLTVLNRRTGAFYRGPAIRSTVPELVSRVAGRVDPLSRQILMRRVPFQELLGPQLTISVAGMVTTASGPCDILRMTDARSRISMFVRRSDHLVDSVSTDTLDRGGRTIASSMRSFTYSKLKGDEAFKLVPKRGQKVLPLPPIKL